PCLDLRLRLRRRLPRLLTLPLPSGVVDAVSSLGLVRVFTGNMTGNVLFLGFALVGVPGIPFLNNAVALVGFVIGAIAAGRIVGRGHRLGSLPTRSIVVLAGAGGVHVVAAVAAALVPALPEGIMVPVTAGLVARIGAR